MKHLKRKLILSVFMLGITIVTLTSSTYAWFVKNREAWLDEFELDIEASEGLLVSADGENFSQDVGLADIQKAIEKKSGIEFGSLKHDAVTLKHEDQKVVFDANGNLVFEKDALESIENSDYMNHKTIAAEAKDYIAFDLWFKAITTGAAHPNYKLRMTETSYVDAADSDVTLQNRLTTPDMQYKSGDTITVNPKNAMRVGVTYIDEEQQKLNIYEPNDALGSAAIEGSVDVKHNKDVNAMYTYYNYTHPLSPFTQAAEDGEGFQTLDNFGLGDCGTFAFSDAENDYNVIKITVYVWLEGWDADYFLGVPPTNVRVKLGFLLD